MSVRQQMDKRTFWDSRVAFPDRSMYRSLNIFFGAKTFKDDKISKIMIAAVSFFPIPRRLSRRLFYHKARAVRRPIIINCLLKVNRALFKFFHSSISCYFSEIFLKMSFSLDLLCLIYVDYNNLGFISVSE